MNLPPTSPLDADDRRCLRAADGYIALGMIAEAEAELASLPLAKRQLPEALGVRILLCQSIGEWATMCETAGHLAAVQPSEPQWWISWAYAARRTDSMTKALEILTQAKRLHEKEAIIHFNAACYLAQLERLDEARVALKIAIRLHEGCRAMIRMEPDLAPLHDEEF